MSPEQPQPQPQPQPQEQPQPKISSVPSNDAEPKPQQTVSATPQTDSVHYHSNPFTSFMAELSVVSSVNPVATLLLGLITALIVFALYFGGLLLAGITSGLGLGVLSFVLILFAIIAVLLFVIRSVAASAAIHISSQHGIELSAKKALLSETAPIYGKFIGASLLSLLFMMTGFVLFFIPGLFVLARLQLVPFVVIAEKKGGFAAIKRSWQLTKGHTVEMFGTLAASPITLGGQGLLGFVGNTSGAANRYHELVMLERSSQAKPEVHWLNYLVIGMVALFIVGYIALVAIAGASINSLRERQQLQSQPTGPYSNPGYYDTQT